MTNTSNSSLFVHINTYNEYKVGILIWKIVSPILIVLGTIGNCLSIIILTRKTIRSSTTALYLTVLAFSDLVVLYSGLLRQWLIHCFGIDFRQINEFSCKLNVWLVYSSLDFSSWILVGVTLERVLSVRLPHNAQTLCTKKKAIALMISIGVTILALNAHLLDGMVFKYSLDSSGNIQVSKCVEANKSYYDFFNVTWPWIDLCAFCVIPLTVIVVGNGLILIKLINNQKKIQSRIVPSCVINGTGPRTTSGHCGKPSSITLLLFTLSIVFLVSTSPICIYNIGYPYWIEGASEHDYAILDLWWAVVNMFMYLNNSVNFLLYCLAGAKFRKEVIRIICFWKQNRVHVFGAVQQQPGHNLVLQPYSFHKNVQ